MKKIICIVLVFNILLISCSKDDTSDEFHDATVLNQQIDCKDFVIQFNPDVTRLPVDSFDNKFSAINLPEAYKIEGKKIKVKVREPKNEETEACTTLGIRYPEIFITSVE